MYLKCILNLNILLFFLVLVFVENGFAQECDSKGLMCISCNEYQKCNAGFPEGKIMSCKNGDNCTDFELKECQMRLKCYGLNECTEAGIFPDPLVDSNFYVCLSDASSGFLKFSFPCPEDNFFNKLTTTCEPRSSTSPSTPSTPPSTPSTPPSTPSIPPSTPSTPPSTPSTPPSTPSIPPSTPSIPPSTPSISPSTPSTPPSTPSIPPSTPSTPPSTPSIPPSTPSTSPSTSISPTSTSISPSTPYLPTESPPFACTGPGIFPNPNNCKMYYRCSTSLKVFFYICPGSSFFNENLLKCSLVITPACQEQILKNSTSTSSPTPSTTVTSSKLPNISMVTATSIVSPFTTTISTASPPTTTASTTSTTITTTTAITTPSTSTSNLPFSCPSTGTYANPVDCKSYYRCSVSGKIFRYNCPGNTYFNEFTNRCSVVITPRCKNLIQG